MNQQEPNYHDELEQFDPFYMEGWREEDFDTDDDDLADAPCPFCDGTGQDRYDLMPCEECDGTGWRYAP